MTFNEIISQCENVQQIILLIEKTHKNAKNKVDVHNPDKNLILYLLGGRAITLCYSAIYLLTTSRLSEFGAIIRLIEETVYLSDYIYSLKDDHEDINKWINNEIITPKKLRKTRVNLFFKFVGHKNKRYSEVIDEFYSELSKYIHPTYGISKLNLNIQSCEFDYKWEDFKNYEIPIFVSLSQSIISVINLFRLCREFYMIDDFYDTILNEKIKILEKLQI